MLGQRFIEVTEPLRDGSAVRDTPFEDGCVLGPTGTRDGELDFEPRWFTVVECPAAGGSGQRDLRISIE